MANGIVENRVNKSLRRAMVIAILLVVLALWFCGCGNVTHEDGWQNISYTESTDYIANPDQGFYRTVFVKLDENGATSSTPRYDGFNLYHLRVDISSFSAVANGERDKAITQRAIDGLNDVIGFYENNGDSVIVRVAYDGFNGVKDQEPSLETMKSHIKSLSMSINAHANAVTAVETGLIGPWGEMHSSKIANVENISSLVDCFLENVQGDIPVLVRTPKMLYHYLGTSLDALDDCVIGEGKRARVGLFNDGYLGSENDLGTYTDRATETEWLGKNVTNRTPFGGEVTVPSSGLHDIDKCVDEMRLMNLSYLNYEWNNEIVQNKWKNSTYNKNVGNEKIYYGKSAYEYIRNRMGYRLVVERSVIKTDGKNATVELDIKNVGFGEFYKSKSLSVLFVDANGNIVAIRNGFEYGGENRISMAVELPTEKGEYGVYVSVHSQNVNGERVYPVAFANSGMFDESLKANRVGTVSVC